MSYKVNKPVNIIKFHKKYYLKILNKDKTQTMRLKELNLNKGDLVIATFDELEETLLLKITKTGYRQFRTITNADAKNEGFETKGELKEELHKIYSGVYTWKKLYYYRFEVMNTMIEMIDNSLRLTWYDYYCKDHDAILEIIHEELNKRPNFMDMNMSKLVVIVKRRCQSEL